MAEARAAASAELEALRRERDEAVRAQGAVGVHSGHVQEQRGWNGGFA